MGGPEFGGQIATRVFPLIRERYPDLTLVMRPAYAFEDMQDPGTDLAFRVGSFHDDRLVVRKLGSFRRRLVAAPQFLRRYVVACPGDLARVPCLTFRDDRPGATWVFETPDGETAVEVAGPIAVRSFGILLDLARVGQGVAFLPEFMVTDPVEKGDLIPCLPDHASRPNPLFLSFRPGARNIARIAAVIDQAEKEAPSLLP